jgi:hypothetical protein
MHIKSLYTRALLGMFSLKKPYTFAGFELRSSVPQANTMTTSPHHHGMSMNAFIDILMVNMHVHMYVHGYVHMYYTLW